MDKVYKEALKNLNTEQRKAVETIEGPVMVIAGPGTGKTQILSMRIAHILAETDTSASSILALTFTESGAISIRKRLRELVGKDAYDVSIHTFHGFANSTIQSYPDYFPSIIGGRQCEPVEQIEIIQNIISENSFEYIKPFGNQFYYVRPIIAAIQDLKREGYTPDKFEILIKKQAKDLNEIDDLYHEKGKYKGQMKGAYVAIEKKINKNHDLLEVYRSYEAEKRARGLYDYEDMILQVLSALETDNDFLLMLQERYLYILADEHQDANRSQNRLLELLSSFHDNPNIFVVGDDKQAIYRFQGASLENFLYFKNRYPNVRIIDLEDNYRSTQHVLDISDSLISNNTTLSEKKLRAQSGKKIVRATLTPAKTQTSEADFITQKIKQLIDSGEEPEEIAVLFRNNKHAGSIRESLVREGVKYSLHGAAAETPHILTEQFLDILRVISDPNDEASLSRILFYSFFNLDAEDIFVFFEQKKKARLSVIEYVQADTENPVSHAILLILDLHKKSENMSLRSFLSVALDETGLVESLVSDKDSARALSEIRSLFALAKKLEDPKRNIKLSEYLAQIDRSREYNLSIFGINDNHKSGVQLMTAHRSKGLEFNTVFIAGLTDNNWGGRKSPEYFYLPELKSLKINEEERNKEDERRLFYVALTRAKQNLFLSYYAENEDGREEIESQFISELGGELFVNKEYKEEPKPDHHVNINNSLFDKNTVEAQFFKRGLNATAVNKYLRCSWDYFFTSLFQIPQTYSTSALFGTAMHTALRTYYENNSQIEAAKATLRAKLFEGDLENNEAERFYDRGASALDGYFKEYATTRINRGDTVFEKSIGVDFDTRNGTIRLTGNLDMLERDSSGGFIVTDFKTGKPKSRNEIEGKTKSGDGNYKRQLVFYSILLRESGDSMIEGVIDFVEPNDNGKYKRESFAITEEERSELKETIETITEDLLSLSFVNKGCKENTCEWCRLAGIIEKGKRV